METERENAKRILFRFARIYIGLRSAKAMTPNRLFRHDNTDRRERASTKSKYPMPYGYSPLKKNKTTNKVIKNIFNTLGIKNVKEAKFLTKFLDINLPFLYSQLPFCNKISVQSFVFHIQNNRFLDQEKNVQILQKIKKIDCI